MSKPKRQTPRDVAPAGAPQSAIADVALLINERRQFEEWIAALEAKRAQTPAQVFTRVHADYESRLRAVVEKLASHGSSLGEELDALKKRLRQIDVEINDHQEERVEIELRAQVGELSTAAVTEALRAADAELAQLVTARKAVDEDIVRVGEFFTAAAGGAAPSAPSASPPPRRSSRTGFDELGFLESVVSEDAEKKPAAPAKKATFELVHEEEKPPSASPRKAASPPEQPAEKRVTPTVVEPVETAVEKALAQKRVTRPAPLSIERASEPALEPSPPRPARSTIAMEQASQTIEPHELPRSSGNVSIDESPPSLLDGITSSAIAGEKPFAANVESNNSLSLKTSSLGDDKSLKCRACSAMNSLTEWYCEKCGAELSVM